MIIVKLQGGLGNQMFQYAFGRSLANRHNTRLYLDDSSLQRKANGYTQRPYELNIFSIQEGLKIDDKRDIPFYEKISWDNTYIGYIREIYIKTLLKKLNPYHLIEKKLCFDPTMLEIKSGYIEGYFQTEKYFINCADAIRRDFIFTAPISKQNQEMVDIIQSVNAISVHIRRGDYISNPEHSFYNVCDIAYYKRAISYIKQKAKDPVFFFFSDDIDRVKKNLVEDQSHYIDFNSGQKNYEDMRLMSLCKHNIIANSSFSRWGAWLNTNPHKIVIAPSEWTAHRKLDYKDIVPDMRVKL